MGGVDAVGAMGSVSPISIGVEEAGTDAGVEEAGADGGAETGG